MRAALRTLARDGWVLGIAAAAALAYVTIDLLESALYVVMSILDGYPVRESSGTIEGLSTDIYPWSAEINGNLVSFEALVRSTALFAIVVPVAALVLHATRSDDERG